MSRRSFLAVLLALLLGAGAGLYAVGTANAATWRSYHGDVFAGHAYGISVPDHAKSLEATFEGNGSAAFSLYDPAGAKVGYYPLDSSVRNALIATPTAGRYTLYAYDITNGALHLRVESDAQPDLQIAKLELTRTDVKLVSSDTAAALHEGTTTTLKAEPVFVTLLYEGSAEGLDATIASDAGNILTITGESGTAMSPGVFSAQSGQRVAQPAHLGGKAFTVSASATSFEGTLYLSALSVASTTRHQGFALPIGPFAPAPAPSNASHESARPAAQPAVDAAAPTTVRLPAARAFAFTASAGTMTLSDPKAMSANATSGARSVVQIYTPDDKLLGVVPLSDSAPTRTLDLPVSGEYVAYVPYARNLVVYASVPGGDGKVREISLVTTTMSISGAPLHGDASTSTVSLPHVPVALVLDGPNSVSVVASATLRNERGVVAWWDSLASAPAAEFAAYSARNATNFASGEHVLEISGVILGDIQLKETHYVRDVVIAPQATQPAPPTSGPTPFDPTRPFSAPSVPTITHVVPR